MVEADKVGLDGLTLRPLLSERRGYLKLYMADTFWSSALCGALALLWGVVRAALTLRALRQSRRDASCATT